MECEINEMKFIEVC